MFERLARVAYFAYYRWHHCSPIYRNSSTIAEVQALLRERLRAPKLVVTSKLEAGHSLLVKLADGRLAKFASSRRDAWRLYLETHLLRALREVLGDRVPSSQFYQAKHPFVIQMLLPGKPIAEGDVPLHELRLADDQFERLCLGIHQAHTIRTPWQLRLFGHRYPAIRAMGRLCCIVPVLLHIRHRWDLIKSAGRCFFSCFNPRQWRWCHLDWHSGNVLVSEDGTVRFIDFALASYAPCAFDWARLLPPEDIGRFRELMNHHNLRVPSRHLLRAAKVMATLYDSLYERKLTCSQAAMRTDGMIERLMR